MSVRIRLYALSPIVVGGWTKEISRSSQGPLSKMGHTTIHMADQHRTGPIGIARQSAFQQDLVLLGCYIATKNHRHHLISKELIENPAIQIRRVCDPQAPIRVRWNSRSNRFQSSV